MHQQTFMNDEDYERNIVLTLGQIKINGNMVPSWLTTLSYLAVHIHYIS